MEINVKADCLLGDTLQCFDCDFLFKFGVEESEESRLLALPLPL